MTQFPIPLPGLPHTKAKIIRPNCCGNCKHKGDQQPNQPSTYECRRFPPIPTTFMVPQDRGQPGFVTHTGWPMVGVDTWCGEWQPKIEMVN